MSGSVFGLARGVAGPRSGRCGAVVPSCPGTAVLLPLRAGAGAAHPQCEAPLTRPGSNGLPPSPCCGQDVPLPDREALGGRSTGTRNAQSRQERCERGRATRPLGDVEPVGVEGCRFRSHSSARILETAKSIQVSPRFSLYRNRAFCGRPIRYIARTEPRFWNAARPSRSTKPFRCAAHCGLAPCFVREWLPLLGLVLLTVWNPVLASDEVRGRALRRTMCRAPHPP